MKSKVCNLIGLMMVVLSVSGCRPDAPSIKKDYGIPKGISVDTVIEYKAFTVGYSAKHLQPLWVSYLLTGEHVFITENTPKVGRNFMPDPHLAIAQANYYDYSNSGYVRGHMARKMDFKWDSEAVQESDYMTNICPQTSDLNGGVWLRIENMARKMAMRYDSLYIVCGPLFTQNDTICIGTTQIHIPSLFYKAFLFKKNAEWHSVAFLVPNDEIHRRNYTELAMTVDRLEEIIHADLFYQLDDDAEKTAESSIDVWLGDYGE